MEMRKFIIEIHPDGSLDVLRVRGPKDAAEPQNNRAWLEGYRQALIHCDDKISTLETFKGSCLSADLEYQGAVKVRDHMSAFYNKLYNKYHF